ncbi:carbohydrate ABC transporter substrate-binding protein (CUT1 family) [Hydrogenispora ethanolica]|uniref:Carbohydrate ABC transporter substrate-binding protein (CUT1 family) n=2 Tax=Hydrogenispora ethanolica TaxID=1082276 RepID=A0A4R1SAL2_HYDET|nr:carbohydrate ABC transporter substrate-binding protein (CUT1 family) [Hydrogenispora ethanolica]
MKRFFRGSLLIFLVIAVMIAAKPTLGIMSEQAKWTQFKNDHLTIHLLSEDTPPTMAVKSIVNEFTAKTGIKVEITQTRLEDVVAKTILDFSAKAGDIELIYTDPYQILSPFHGHLADMRKFMNDPALPKIPLGLNDFIKTDLIAGGYMIDKDRLLGIPYDCPTMIWIYRKDIFLKYKDKFMADRGYDWTPGSNLSWEQYYEIAKWINEHVPEVKAGTGHQALMYDSLQCDFSNVLAAYGGKYFANDQVNLWGSNLPGKCMLDQPQAIEATRFYKKLLSIAHPGSTSWDWNGLAEAFAAGDIAMAPEWHEFASTFEDPARSKVAGKVGYALLPHGANGSKNHWGGTNISINSYASEKKQKAAWLYILWATSPNVQKKLLLRGSTPTRYAVYNDRFVKQWIKFKVNPIMESLHTVTEAWKPENIFLRPKTPYWLDVNTVVFTNLSYMLAGKLSPEEAMRDATLKIDQITGYNKMKK